MFYFLGIGIFFLTFCLINSNPVAVRNQENENGTFKCPPETACGPDKEIWKLKDCPSGGVPCDLFKASFNSCSKQFDEPICCNNYCGGCNLIWYSNGEPIDCLQDDTNK